MMMLLRIYWFLLPLEIVNLHCVVEAAFFSAPSSSPFTVAPRPFSLEHARRTKSPCGFCSELASSTRRRCLFVVCRESPSSSSSSSSIDERRTESNDDAVVFLPVIVVDHELAATSVTDPQQVTVETTLPKRHDTLPGGTCDRKVNSQLETSREGPSSRLVATGIAVAAAAAAALVLHSDHGNDLLSALTTKSTNPHDLLHQVMDRIDAMDHAAAYYALFYAIAELAGIPATPLTISAGVLLGFWSGVAAVLTGAMVAASVAFGIGQTVLRTWVEKQLEQNVMFGRIDRAVRQEGFLLVLLVRLSPVFPFGLSSYLYGGSSITFGSYFLGTLMGFAPATLAYVYAGMVGKTLALGDGGSQPWYVYAAGFVVLATFLKVVTDVATRIIESVDDDGHIPSL